MLKNIEKLIPDKRKELKHLFNNNLSHKYSKLHTISRIIILDDNLYEKTFWGEYNAKIYG